MRGKLKQHAGLADSLIGVLDLSSPITEDRDIAARLYGRMITTMLDPSTSVTVTRDRTEIWKHVGLARATRLSQGGSAGSNPVGATEVAAGQRPDRRSRRSGP